MISEDELKQKTDKAIVQGLSLKAGQFVVDNALIGGRIGYKLGYRQCEKDLTNMKNSQDTLQRGSDAEGTGYSPEIRYGGGHCICQKCGRTHFGSTIHYCEEGKSGFVEGVSYATPTKQTKTQQLQSAALLDTIVLIKGNIMQGNDYINNMTRDVNKLLTMRKLYANDALKGNGAASAAFDDCNEKIKLLLAL